MGLVPARRNRPRAQPPSATPSTMRTIPGVMAPPSERIGSGCQRWSSQPITKSPTKTRGGGTRTSAWSAAAGPEPGAVNVASRAEGYLDQESRTPSMGGGPRCTAPASRAPLRGSRRTRRCADGRSLAFTSHRPASAASDEVGPIYFAACATNGELYPHRSRQPEQLLLVRRTPPMPADSAGASPPQMGNRVERLHHVLEQRVQVGLEPRHGVRSAISAFSDSVNRRSDFRVDQLHLVQVRNAGREDNRFALAEPERLSNLVIVGYIFKRRLDDSATHHRAFSPQIEAVAGGHPPEIAVAAWVLTPDREPSQPLHSPSDIVPAAPEGCTRRELQRVLDYCSPRPGVVGRWLTKKPLEIKPLIVSEVRPQRFADFVVLSFDFSGFFGQAITLGQASVPNPLLAY